MLLFVLEEVLLDDVLVLLLVVEFAVILSPTSPAI